MALLKEDGSLDIERINKLPIEEYMNVIGDLTKEQYEVYLSKLPINESHEPTRAIKVNYTMGVAAEEVINKIGKRSQNNFFKKEQIKSTYLPKLKKEISVENENIKENEENPKITKIFKKSHSKIHIKENN